MQISMVEGLIDGDYTVRNATRSRKLPLRDELLTLGPKNMRRIEDYFKFPSH